MDKVSCARCGRKQPINDDKAYWCAWCHMMFDGEPEEGGNYSDRDPAARMEREERRK